MTDAEIAAALEKATPGPWEVLDRIAPTCVQALGCVDTCAGVAVWGTVARALPVEDMDCEGRTWTASGEPEGNARLIAMAPTLARLALDRGKEIERLRAADRAEARTTLPDDLRRQVLAAVHNAQRACERILAAFEHSTPREDLAYSVGVVAMRSAILAEFGLNPDGTMKEPPA